MQTPLLLVASLVAVQSFAPTTPSALSASRLTHSAVARRAALTMQQDTKEEKKTGFFGRVVPSPTKEEEAPEEELTESKKLMQKVKDAGVAGIISYIFWEWAFWGVSVPVCIFGYREVTGHWPDYSNQEDLQKLGAEAFAFVNVARFAVPLRIGLALGTTPWVQNNIVDNFQKKEQ